MLSVSGKLPHMTETSTVKLMKMIKCKA